MTRLDDDSAAQELDGPGAIVSHAEALEAWRDGHDSGPAIARALGVSDSTGRRLLRNLGRANLLTEESTMNTSNLRPATEAETADWLAGYVTGYVETEDGVFVPAYDASGA